MATSHQVHTPLQPRLWLGAFTGFYRPTASEVVGLDPVARFLYSARSVILVISAQAAVIAGLLAITEHAFHWLDFVLVVVGFVAAHMISNLSNDFFGWRRGHDTPDSPRLRYTVHPMAAGVDSRTLLTGLGMLVVLAGAICVYFAVHRGLGAVAFAVAGGGLLFLYDASPVTLKALGLGEIASFAVWGPLMIGGGDYVVSGSLHPVAFWASVPYGLGVMSILVGKHIDQADFDLSQGQHTLPVLLGNRTARVFNCAAVAGMYVSVAALVAVRALAPWVLLVAVALPRGWRALRVMSRPRPSAAPDGYVGWPLWYHRVCLLHNRRFGWLYIAGLALAAILTTAGV